MGFFSFLKSYVVWHYSLALRDYYSFSISLVEFIYKYFNIGIHTRTLFFPWRRMGEGYGKTSEIGRNLSTLFINSLMRIFGFFARLVVIIIGLVADALLIVLSIVFFLTWLVLPILIIYVLAISLIVLFK